MVINVIDKIKIEQGAFNEDTSEQVQIILKDIDSVKDNSIAYSMYIFPEDDYNANNRQFVYYFNFSKNYKVTNDNLWMLSMVSNIRRYRGPSDIEGLNLIIAAVNNDTGVYTGIGRINGYRSGQENQVIDI